ESVTFDDPRDRLSQSIRCAVAWCRHCSSRGQGPETRKVGPGPPYRFSLSRPDRPPVYPRGIEAAMKLGLFPPKREHGIDARRAPRGPESRQGGDGYEDNRDAGERHGIER